MSAFDDLTFEDVLEIVYSRNKGVQFTYFIKTNIKYFLGTLISNASNALCLKAKRDLESQLKYSMDICVTNEQLISEIFILLQES